jgi:putative acetyltransferase
MTATHHSIHPIRPEQALHLIQKLDAYQASLYPAASNHLDAIDTLSRPNVSMLGVFEQGRLAAIGAVKIIDGYGEIKRLYVPIEHRGKGLAKKIMTGLEQYLIENKVFVAKLETGIHQPEAIGLYQQLGYERCGPFGEYKSDPLSVFMTKKLDSAAAPR